MKKLYLYNEGSKAMHIYGGCKDANSTEYKSFDSETDLISFAGRQVFLCKTCERYRDEILRHVLLKKQQ